MLTRERKLYAPVPPEHVVRLVEHRPAVDFAETQLKRRRAQAVAERPLASRIEQQLDPLVGSQQTAAVRAFVSFGIGREELISPTPKFGEIFKVGLRDRSHGASR